MDNNNDLITLSLGILILLIGLILVIRRIVIVKKNKIIIGEIFDRRSGHKDHYYPVIKYDVNNETKVYQSSHHSILQRIGGKIRLVYNEKEKRILGTFGEMFFIPVNILIVGLFITIIMVLYKILD